MQQHTHSSPTWLPALVDQVQKEFEQFTRSRQRNRPDLESELESINSKIQGWSLSLANPSLSASVRESIEQIWKESIERKVEIESELQDIAIQAQTAQDLIRAEDVTERLKKLAQVLGSGDPTRGNLELSLHIDRIVGSSDGKVTMKMCKLGIAPNAAEILVNASASSAPEAAPHKTRRRAKLRVSNFGDREMQAQSYYVTDQNRFAGLNDEFFWTDEFSIPKHQSWASKNAEKVYRRRQESRASYAALAEEFEVTPPTIGKALKAYLAENPSAKDEVKLRSGGKRRPKFDLSIFGFEARQLSLDGWSKLRIAKKYRCSTPTVNKAIEHACKALGESVRTREDSFRQKVVDARSHFERGLSLDAIADEMDLSDVTIRKYLRKSFAAEGIAMPDLRRKIT